MTSNAILIGGKEYEPPAGLTVRNYQDPAVHRFVNRARTPQVVDAVVVHETVTTSWSSTVEVLKARGLGVHFIVDEHGVANQHADLLTDEMWHATTFNGRSVGIETVNPYEPQFDYAGSPWPNEIAAPWAVGGKYVLPTPAQAEAVSQLFDFLSSAAANPLTIPQLWPGFQGTHRLSLGRVAKDEKAENAGLHAHMYFGHADGAWLVLYAWLRLEAMLDPEPAYAKARELATDAHSVGVDLQSYFDDNPYLDAG